MAKDLSFIRDRMAVVDVGGKKRLVLAGRTIQTKAEVEQRIANLDAEIGVKLPKARAELDGAALVADRQQRIDRTIAQLEGAKAKLSPEALVTESQTLIDGKIERLADVRTVLAEMLGEIE